MSDENDINIEAIPYDEFVRDTKKDPEKILEILTPTMIDAEHMQKGICGEAGELVDCIKNWTVYGKELDMDNLIEELGDLEWYLEGLRQIFNLDREEIIKENKIKLSKRYRKIKYSDQEAIERHDKR